MSGNGCHGLRMAFALTQSSVQSHGVNIAQTLLLHDDQIAGFDQSPLEISIHVWMDSPISSFAACPSPIFDFGELRTQITTQLAVQISSQRAAETIQYFFHTTPLRSAQPQRFCSKWKLVLKVVPRRALGDGSSQSVIKSSVVGAMFRRSRQSTGLSGELRWNDCKARVKKSTTRGPID
jgi:hypothetical protein